jgi:hypothetical protein
MLNYEKLEDSVRNILKERTSTYKLANIRIEATNMTKKKLLMK